MTDVKAHAAEHGKFYETKNCDGVDCMIYVDQCQEYGPGFCMISVHTYWPDAIEDGDDLFLTARALGLEGRPAELLAAFPDNVLHQIVASFRDTIAKVRAGDLPGNHVKVMKADRT